VAKFLYGAPYKFQIRFAPNEVPNERESKRAPRLLQVKARKHQNLMQTDEKCRLHLTLSSSGYD
jgi:hypothetical protein